MVGGSGYNTSDKDTLVRAPVGLTFCRITLLKDPLGAASSVKNGEFSTPRVTPVLKKKKNFFYRKPRCLRTRQHSLRSMYHPVTRYRKAWSISPLQRVQTQTFGASHQTAKHPQPQYYTRLSKGHSSLLK